jgi:Domain of unknown function (DUF4189)
MSNTRIQSRARICIGLTTGTFIVRSALAAGALANGQVPGRTFGSVSYNAPSYEAAEQNALSRCNQQGPGCQVVKYFSSTCIAVATQVGGGGRSWAMRPSVGEAQSAAMNLCVPHGRPCQVKLAACDTTGLPSAYSPPHTSPPPSPAPPAPPVQPAPPSRSEPRGCSLYPELCP